MNKIKAIIYDFDGTLTPNAFPRFDILEKAGIKGGSSNPEFRKKLRNLGEQRNISSAHAVALYILDILKAAGYKPTDDNIAFGADRRTYRPGVLEFLQKTQTLGINNYLISSGIKAYIEHISIAPYFQEIYATTFCYDSNDEITGIAHAMGSESKIDALRGIAQLLNGSPEDCQNLIYIGDGPTDLPAMAYIAEHQGTTIMLQDDQAQTEDQNAAAGATDFHYDTAKIVNHSFPADFRAGSELDQFIFS